jgi:hypothetical protein
MIDVTHSQEHGSRNVFIMTALLAGASSELIAFGICCIQL